MMRRSPFAMFLLVGFGLLLGAALFGGMESVAAVLAAPFIVLGVIFKVVLFFLLFGLFARFVGRRSGRSWDSDEWRHQWKHHHRGGWSSHESPRADRPEESSRRGRDHFEEWHRLAHARQEVDDHVPPVET